MKTGEVYVQAYKARNRRKPIPSYSIIAILIRPNLSPACREASLYNKECKDNAYPQGALVFTFLFIGQPLPIWVLGERIIA
ncbi:hypothetical protein SAMN04487894_108184 [Niabella drilacis]|uniref:Uncharacterized protein n=1 Tax=Niabella drilacis (strain DSM 25811 / CCM 8410 / CCUG 62505 / LMG 26954 / E90) TaxID=1285928 RepID=A0A1G6U8E5_NIADE|nr:hypothetical protein SAMN04487894_108184 [Niabella drilacis]